MMRACQWLEDNAERDKFFLWVDTFEIHMAEENSGGIQDMVERFWRNIFGGAASCRFHRPDRWLTGIGLHSISQQNIKSMRMFTDALNIFDGATHGTAVITRGE